MEKEKLLKTKIQYIHLLNKVWHLTEEKKLENLPMNKISNYLENRKIQLQLELLNQYPDDFYTVDDPETPNYLSIRWKENNQDACHISKDKIGDK